MAFLRNAPSSANLLCYTHSVPTEPPEPKSADEENAVFERNTIITTDIKSIAIKFLMKSIVFLRNALSTANYLCYTRSVPEELIKNKVAFETQKKKVYKF